MSRRELISDDGAVRRFRVFTDQGELIGTDEETIPTPVQVNEMTLRTRATQALATNAAYLQVTAPTNAQVVAQVTALTRECSALIRLVLNLTDTTGGS